MRAEKQLKFKGHEEGPEKWVKEMPVETVGTAEEREKNFERYINELREEKKKLDISEEEFKERLEKAEKFVEKLPILHFTDFRSVEEIFKSGKFLSVSELKKPEFRAHTDENDIRCGLDKFIFSTVGIRNFSGEAALVINNKILNRQDCVVTPEDIVTTCRRCFVENKRWSGAIDSESLKKIQKEYKKTAISGKDFKKFLSQFIATYHKNPEESIDYFSSGKFIRQKREREELYEHIRERPIPLWKGEWYDRPEIKTMKEIKAEDISFIVVPKLVYANLLISKGIPKDRIKVENLENNKR